MQWLLSKLPWYPSASKAEQAEAFARREAELQRRFQRLTREVEVMQRTENQSEDQAQSPVWD